MTDRPDPSVRGAWGRFELAAAATLSVATVRTRWASFAGAFVAVGLGVALMTMTMLVWSSSGAKVPSRVEGAPLIAVSSTIPNENGTPSERRPWSPAVSADLVDQLQAVSGVAQAVPDRSFYAQATRGGAPVAAGDEALGAGHGWSSAALAPYPLTEGSPPRSDTQVVLDQRLGFTIGEQVSMLFVAGPRSMTVVGLVDARPTGGRAAPLDKAVFVDDDLATELSPGVSAIALVLQPGASVPDVDHGAAAVLDDGASIVSGQARSALEPAFSAHERFLGAQLLSAMALLGGFVSVFVVASTSAFNAAERRQELGLLRIIGASPRQVQAMVLGEAATTGLLAGAVGAGLGAGAAPAMGHLLQHIGVAAADFTITYSVLPILVATLAGITIATAGAWAASRQASKTAPMHALRDAQVERSAMTRSRWIAGGCALVTGLALTIATATTNTDDRIYAALLSAMALTVAAALLAPVVIAPVVRSVTWPARRARGAGPLLLRAELANATGRSAALAAPVIATVGFVVLISGYVPTSRQAYPAQVTQALKGQSIIWPKDKPGLTDAEVATASSSEVLRAAVATRIFTDKPGQGQTVLDGVGWLAPGDQGRDHAVVSTLLADKFGWQQGQRIDVGFLDGATEQLTIVAVRDIDPARAGFTLSGDTVRDHDPNALTEAVFVPQGDAPTDVGSGAVVYDAYTYANADYQQDSRLLRQFSLVLIIVAVGYTGIAVANTMAMSAQGRAGSFRALKLAGATNRQIIAAVVSETVLIVGIGVALGFTVTLPSLAGIAAGFSQSVGRPVSLQIDTPTVATTVAACLALALGASALTTWRSIRPAPPRSNI